MSKMILLELTEKEAELVRKAIKARFVLPREMDKEDPTDYDRRLQSCSDILTKIDIAEEPKLEESIGYQDLFHIISVAKDEYLSLPADLHISNKKIEEKDFVKIALAKSVIVWLNGRNLLKRLAGFEFTDHSYQFEDTND